MSEYVEKVTLQSNVAAVAAADAGGITRLDAVLRKLMSDIDRSSHKDPFEGLESGASKAQQKVQGLDSYFQRLSSKFSSFKMPDFGGGGGGAAAGGEAGAAGGGAAAGAAAAVAAVVLVAGAVKKIADVVAEVGVATTKFAIAASDFRSETSSAFQHMYGSAAIADGMYQKIVALAVRTGQSKEHFAEEARKLAATGFSADEVPKILQSLADFEKVKGAGSGDKIEKLLEKVKAADKFDAKTVSALAKQGIATGDVYAVLEKKLGKTHAQVEAMLKAGQIKGDTGVESVVETLDKKFGGAAKVDTVGGYLSSLSTKFESLFDGIDTSPIKDAMSNVLSILDGPAGGELKSSITELFGSTFKMLFGELSGGGAKEKITGIVHNIAEGIHSAAVVIRAVTPVFGAAVDATLSLAGAGARVAAFFANIGGGVAETIAPLFQEIGNGMRFATSVFDDVVDRFSALTDAFDLSSLKSLGSDLVAGIVEGLESGGSAVMNALVGVVEGAKSAAERVLGIASPSKVFEKIGGFTTEGMAVGMRRGANDVGDAGADVAKMAWNGAAYAPSVGGGGAGGAGGSSFSSGASTYHLTVNMPAGATGGAEAGEELYQVFERHVRRYERDRYERVGKGA